MCVCACQFDILVILCPGARILCTRPSLYQNDMLYSIHHLLVEILNKMYCRVSNNRFSYI